jgi:hypothetical protein
MNKFHFGKGFKLGSLISLFLSAGVNLLPLKLTLVSSCNYCVRSVGFPFRFYEDSKFGEQFQRHIIWSALVSDIFILIIFSFVIGLLLNFIWSKLATPKINLK